MLRDPSRFWRTTLRELRNAHSPLQPCQRSPALATACSTAFCREQRGDPVVGELDLASIARRVFADSGQRERGPAVGSRPGSEEMVRSARSDPTRPFVGRHPTELAVHGIIEDSSAELVAETGWMRPSAAPCCRRAPFGADAVANTCSSTPASRERAVGPTSGAYVAGSEAASGKRAVATTTARRAARAPATRRRRTRRSGSQAVPGLRVSSSAANAFAVVAGTPRLEQHPRRAGSWPLAVLPTVPRTTRPGSPP